MGYSSQRATLVDHSEARRPIGRSPFQDWLRPDSALIPRIVALCSIRVILRLRRWSLASTQRNMGWDFSLRKSARRCRPDPPRTVRLTRQTSSVPPKLIELLVGRHGRMTE